MRFVILAPPYSDSSSGIRACFRLGHWLNTLGQTCHVLAGQGEPVPREWDVRMCIIDKVPVPDDVIAVYPEVVTGNPLQAKHVARWVLNKPGLIGGTKTYDPMETVFYAPQLTGDDYLREAAQSAAGPREVYPLQTSVHEPHLFYPTRRTDRKGVCYFVYKGADVFAKSGHLLPTNQWRLIDRSAPLSRVELADLFHRSEAFYSWDAHSAITREAAMCGCPTWIVDEYGEVTEVSTYIPIQEYQAYLQPPQGIERLIAMAE